MRVETFSRVELLLSALGLLLGGAGLGVATGGSTLVTNAGALPMITLGVAVLMLPALYIFSALMGAAPPVKKVLIAGVHGLQANGILLLGLSPALLFLLGTAESFPARALISVSVVGTAALVAIRMLYRKLFSQRPRPLVLGLFAAWSLVALGLGGSLFGRAFHI